MDCGSFWALETCRIINIARKKRFTWRRSFLTTIPPGSMEFMLVRAWPSDFATIATAGPWLLPHRVLHDAGLLKLLYTLCCH
jgi:hypothetical protein